MKLILKILLALLFFAGLLGHFFMPEMSSRMYFLGLLCMTLAATTALGFYWSSQIILGAPVQAERADEKISRLLDGHLTLLQGARPKLFLFDSRTETGAAVLRAIGRKFSGSFMCALALLGLFGIVAGEFFGAGEGVFASLFNSEVGRAISVVIGQYMTVSAGGFVFAGLRLSQT